MKKLLFFLLVLVPVLAWGQTTIDLSKTYIDSTWVSIDVDSIDAGYTDTDGLLVNDLATMNLLVVDSIHANWFGGSDFSFGTATDTATFNGYVGIGTTSPTSKFELDNGDIFLKGFLGGASNTNLSIRSHTATSTTSSYLRFQKSHSNLFTNVATVTSEDLGRINWEGNTGSAFVSAATIKAIQNGTASTYIPADLLFYTSNGTIFPERMRIKSTGEVGINTTLPTQEFDVTGDANISDTLFANVIVATGNITGCTNVTLDTDATIVLTAAMCRNSARFNNDADAIDYTLPGAAAGLVVIFYDIAGGVITIDPVDGTDTIYLNGVSVGAGDAIDSPGAVGNFIALMAIDATRWVTIGRSGTWVDGGAD